MLLVMIVGCSVFFKTLVFGIRQFRYSLAYLCSGQTVRLLAIKRRSPVPWCNGWRRLSLISGRLCLETVGDSVVKNCRRLRLGTVY